MRAFLDTLEPDALAGISAAAFDTRLKAPMLLSGSAARAIANRLDRKGARLIARPESFLVEHGEGPLAEGGLNRARSWEGQLAAAFGEG